MRKQPHEQLKCPVCGKRLIDCNHGVKSQVSIAEEAAGADYFTKCKNCKTEIGIKKIS